MGSFRGVKGVFFTTIFGYVFWTAGSNGCDEDAVLMSVGPLLLGLASEQASNEACRDLKAAAT
jgi:hypothetical protein